MPDISMCQNKECPLSKKCYRFLAEPNPYRQSYFVDLKPKLRLWRDRLTGTIFAWAQSKSYLNDWDPINLSDIEDHTP